MDDTPEVGLATAIELSQFEVAARRRQEAASPMARVLVRALTSLVSEGEDLVNSLPHKRDEFRRDEARAVSLDKQIMAALAALKQQP